MKLLLIATVLFSVSAFADTYEVSASKVSINSDIDYPDVCRNEVPGFVGTILSNRAYDYSFSLFYNDVLVSKPIFTNLADCRIALDRMKSHLKKAQSEKKGLRISRDSQSLPRIIDSPELAAVPEIKKIATCKYVDANEKPSGCGTTKIFSALVECKDELGLTISTNVMCMGARLPAALNCYNSKNSGRPVDLIHMDAANKSSKSTAGAR